MMGASMLEGMAKKDAAYRNAKIERKNAVQARVAEQLGVRGAKMQQTELLSGISAETGARGLDITQGSPMQAYLRTARETELEILMAQKASDTGFLNRMQNARNLEEGGDNAMAGAVLEGAAKVYSYMTKSGMADFKPSSSEGGGTLTKPGKLSVPSGYWGSR